MITWLTSDTQGCVNFELNQSGPGRPLVSAPPTPTSTAEPPPPPQPTMGVIKTTCNTQNMDPRFIQLTLDVPPAIPEFCSMASNLRSGPGSVENKPVGDKQINSKNSILPFDTWLELQPLHSREDSYFRVPFSLQVTRS
jgi:hypothetical protein